MTHTHDALKATPLNRFRCPECNVGKVVKFVKFSEKVVAIISKYFTNSILKQIKIG